MSSAVRPAWASAASAARVPSTEVVSSGPAMWRWRMPVRCTIHSSEVSSRAARSALVTTWAGSALPVPRRMERSMIYPSEGGATGDAAAAAAAGVR